MAYNSGRGGEGVNNVGMRRDPFNNIRGQLGNSSGQTPFNNRRQFDNVPGRIGPPFIQRGTGPRPQIKPQQKFFVPQHMNPQPGNPAPTDAPAPVPPPQTQQQQPQEIKQDPPKQSLQNNEDSSTPPTSDGNGDNGDQKNGDKPHFTKGARVSKKERQRRRNLRLAKILQPKNAVMILNEIVKSASYCVNDIVPPTDANLYKAQVLVDGIIHVGFGRSKMEAKGNAAEAALRHIVKNRQYSALARHENDDMDAEDDQSLTVPWQHVASFALFKLLNSWGDIPLQTGASKSGDLLTSPHQNRPAAKIPENAAEINPLMLMNQVLPGTQFEELERTGTPPNIVFTFKCIVNGKVFIGTGSAKKIAKKMAAFAVCSKILNIEYPPEVYTPDIKVQAE